MGYTIKDFKVTTLPTVGAANSRYYLLNTDNTVTEYITDRNGNFREVKASGSGGSGDIAGFVTNETPTGSLNGSNATFATLNNFSPGTERVYSNGQRLKKPADYNTSGTTIIILTFSPLSTENITVDYTKL